MLVQYSRALASRFLRTCLFEWFHAKVMETKRNIELCVVAVWEVEANMLLPGTSLPFKYTSCDFHLILLAE